MENNITIVDAIKTVLQDSSEGMTSQEIYNKIVERKLYTFGAKTPEAAVHAKLRVYCRDLDFPSSSPTKYFYLKKRIGKTNYYALINPESKEDNFQNELIQDDSENEMLAEEKIERAYELHVKELEDNLIERILQCKPEFFERLVVELLMKMGYGYDRSSQTPQLYTLEHFIVPDNRNAKIKWLTKDEESIEISFTGQSERKKKLINYLIVEQKLNNDILLDFDVIKKIELISDYYGNATPKHVGIITAHIENMESYKELKKLKNEEDEKEVENIRNCYNSFLDEYFSDNNQRTILNKLLEGLKLTFINS